MYVTRDYTALIEDVSTQERMVTARINTASIDRYRTVIDPQGGDLSKYNKVVLWEHGKDPTRGSRPIGKNMWVRQTANAIVARTQFAKDEYSQGLFEMYRDGFLNGWSVNVLPTHGTYGPPSQAELRARPELADCETVYRKWELAEYSGVSVPGNAEALTMLEARGIWFPPECRTVEPVPDDVPEPEEEEEQLIEVQPVGRSLLSLRREMADDFTYLETRLITRMRDLGDLLKGRV